MTGWANATFSKLLNGYNSRIQAYSGLLEKCPAISFLDRTVTPREAGHSTQRRSKVFTWDLYLYDSETVALSGWREPERTATGPGEGEILRWQERGADLIYRRFLQVQKMNHSRWSHQKRKKRIIHIVPQERG